MTRCAGLFHFPEGNINNDYDSQNILTAMIYTIEPTEVCIAFGTATIVQELSGLSVGSGNEVTAAMENHSKLSSFVRKVAPDCVVRTMPAHSGVVHVRYANGRPLVGIGEIEGITDLRAEKEGDHGAYALFGKDLLA